MSDDFGTGEGILKVQKELLIQIEQLEFELQQKKFFLRALNEEIEYRIEKNRRVKP